MVYLPTFRANLRSLRRDLTYLQQVWRSAGAEGVALISDGQVIACVPKKLDTNAPMLKAPLQVEDSILLLCVIGIRDVSLQSRLFADATMIQRLIVQELELDTVTEELVNTQDQLLTWYELTNSLQQQTDLSAILKTLTQTAHNIIDAEHTFIVHTLNGGVPIVSQAGDEINFSLEDYHTWYLKVQVANSYLNTRYDGEDRLLILPITSDESVLAAIGFAKRFSTFATPTIKLAKAIAQQSSAYIQRALLYQSQLNQERAKAEIQLAHDVQMSLLPDVPDISQDVDIWAHAKPAREVGGDLYDFVQTGDNLHIAVGDVSGKGMSAALVMVMTRTVIRVTEDDPASVLDKANQYLYDDLTQISAFVTLFTATYDVSSHKITYANAGHSPVILCRADGTITMLESDSPPVGVLPMMLAENHELHLDQGDVLIIATDGIPEAQSPIDTIFGYELMNDLIINARHQSARAIGEILLNAAHVFTSGLPPSDDQTIVVIKRKGD